MVYALKEAQGQAAMLRYKGTFDYDGFTNMILKWLYDHGYKVTEGKHKHKMSCPHGFEIEWNINGERRISDFIKYSVDFKMHLWDAHEVDAVKGGKKIKLWNARMEVKSSFKVILDYQDKWDTPFKAKLLYFLAEYVLKKEIIVKHADHLYYKVYKVHNMMTKFLGMEARETAF